MKDLKAEVRSLRDGLDGLKNEVHRVDVAVARLQTEFGLAKWLLGLMLMATVSGIGGGIWWAATLAAEVRHLAGVVAAEKANPQTLPTPRAN